MNTERLKEIIKPISQRMKDAQLAFDREESLLGDALEQSAFDAWMDAFEEIEAIVTTQTTEQQAL